VNNTALKPDYYGTAAPQSRPVQRPKPQARPKAQPKTQQVSIFKGVLLMGAIAVMLVVMISRYAMISQGKLKNQEMAGRIEQLEDEAQHFALSLSRQTDANMQKIAKEELNMGFPTSQQVMNVQMAGIAEETEEESYSNWFDSILDQFNHFERGLMH
jgi:cell division protein FtsL